MRPDAEALLNDLLDALEIWRSHQVQRDLHLARAEGAVAAYAAVGIMSSLECDEWLERFRSSGSAPA